MLVLFTLILPALLGVMALGADFSIIYFNWAMVQKAADAAALAGASQLTGVPGSASAGSAVQTAAVNYVNGYACLNGISDPNPTNTYATICPTEASHPGGFADKIAFTNVTDTQVSVGIQRTVPYFFGKMIGLNTAGVAAKATAATNSATRTVMETRPTTRRRPAVDAQEGMPATGHNRLIEPGGIQPPIRQRHH